MHLQSGLTQRIGLRRPPLTNGDAGVGVMGRSSSGDAGRGGDGVRVRSITSGCFVDERGMSGCFGSFSSSWLLVVNCPMGDTTQHTVAEVRQASVL